VNGPVLPQLKPVLNVTKLFGCIGVTNLFMLWPVMLLIHYTGIETIHFPSADVLPKLLLNAFVGTGLSDFIWATSVVLTSPVVATVSLSGTVPLAMLADVVFKDKTFDAPFAFGSALVVLGFILVNIASAPMSDKKEDESLDDELPVSEPASI
jgi:solute carrier family 35 protein F5